MEFSLTGRVRQCFADCRSRDVFPKVTHCTMRRSSNPTSRTLNGTQNWISRKIVFHGIRNACESSSCPCIFDLGDHWPLWERLSSTRLYTGEPQHYRLHKRLLFVSQSCNGIDRARSSCRQKAGERRCHAQDRDRSHARPDIGWAHAE
jgi:hypothetical protein